jgi:hypothetical protein
MGKDLLWWVLWVLTGIGVGLIVAGAVCSVG